MMKKETTLLFIFLLLAAADAEGLNLDVDWPIPFHDISHTGHIKASSHLNIKNIKQVCSYKTDDRFTGSVIADIDRDGKAEIILGSSRGGLYILNASCVLMNSYKTGSIVNTPAVFEVYNNSIPYIIFSTVDGSIYMLNHDLEVVWVFHINSSIESTPTAANLDFWPEKEILATAADGFLYVLNHRGELLRKIQLHDPVTSTPALGDINRDKILEIAVGVTANRLEVLNYPGLQRMDYTTEGDVGTPTIYDVNRCGRDEIIIPRADGSITCLYLTEKTTTQTIRKCSNGVCTLEPVKYMVLAKLWEHKTEGEVSSAPAVADIDLDGRVEVIAGSSDKSLYILDSEGKVKHRYSTNSRILGSPAVADFDGDGFGEIVFASGDGYIYVLNSTGYGLWMHKIDDLDYQPIIADLDRDNSLEVVAAAGGSVHVFGVEAASKPENSSNVSADASVKNKTLEKISTETTSTTSTITKATSTTTSDTVDATSTTTAASTTTLLNKKEDKEKPTPPAEVDVTPLNMMFFVSGFLLVSSIVLATADLAKDYVRERLHSKTKNSEIYSRDVAEVHEKINEQK